MNAIADNAAHNHTIPAIDLKPGMTVQITDLDLYRDSLTDELMWDEQTWQATVSDVQVVWNAPSELYVSFTDGPGAWVLRNSRIPLVMGPVNASGRF